MSAALFYGSAIGLVIIAMIIVGLAMRHVSSATAFAIITMIMFSLAMGFVSSAMR